MRLVLHVDLDAFYCQVEQLRLGIAKDVPLAVQQWSSVIAVNYPARARGITRHLSVQECLGRCPELLLVHVATMSVEDEPLGTVRLHSANAGDSIDSKTSKASLDPYRRASRSIMEAIREFFPYPVIIEKASVDEAFIEIPVQSAQEYGASEFIGHPVIEGDDIEARDEQDTIIRVGTVVADDLRAAVHDKLGYAMSAGIAKNKTLAKLASAQHKPNNQTFVLDRHIDGLMRQTPFAKIRFLGGKLGDSLREDGNVSDDPNDDNVTGPQATQSAYDLQSVSVEQLAGRTGDRATASWVYNVIRGEDDSPVVDRSLTKTFLSVKQTRPPLRDLNTALRWLRLFAAELASRMEDELAAAKRWPHTLTLHYRRPGFNAKSRACPLRLESPDPVRLYDIAARSLVNPVHHEQHSLLPLNMIGLSVSKFSGRAKGSRSIEGFLQNVKSGVLSRREDIVGESERWQCPKCSVWYGAHQSDKIQEHADYHAAMEPAREV